jgi:hypothetical protein
MEGLGRERLESEGVKVLFFVLAKPKKHKTQQKCKILTISIREKN